MEFMVKEGEETRITLDGKLDFARAPLLMEALMALKGKAISTILFECKALTYISSAGIRAILYAHQKISPGVGIIMEDVNKDVQEALDMCGFYDYIEFSVSS